MSPNQSIVELFKKEYAVFDEFPDQRSATDNFKCSCKLSCNVDLTKEASYTPLLGDEGSTIMIIAESPSTSQGVGCHLGGKSKNVKGKKKNDNISTFLEFIKNQDEGRFPYFTDIVKCGLQKTRVKEVLTTRKKYCIQKYLIQEIKTINPKKIICLGNEAYNQVVLLIQSLGLNVEVSKITHYSNSASLTISCSDKKNIIWPIELGLINKSEAQERILSLEHLKNRINKLG